MEASAAEFSKIAVGATDWDYYRYPFLRFFFLNFDTQLVSLAAVHLSCYC